MQVAVLSLAGARVQTEDAYIRYLWRTLAGQADQAAGLGLAVLPAHTALFFALRCGLIPKDGSLSGAVQNYQQKAAAINERFFQVHARLAQERGCYLVPGTFLEQEEKEAEKRFYICTALLGPDGTLLGTQRQTHLTADEKALGFTRGGEVNLIQTPLGKIGLVVNTDAWYPEVSRIMALKGAEIVCHPGAMLSGTGHWHFFAGMWKDVQQNQFFCLESQLHASLEGQSFSGPLSIHAPCEMTDGDTGFLARGRPGQEALATQLNQATRKKVIQAYPLLGLLNPEAYGLETKPAAEKPSRHKTAPGMPGWQAKLFLHYLQAKARPARIRQYLERSHAKSGAKTRQQEKVRTGPKASQLRQQMVRAAAIQVKLSLYSDPLDYAEEMRRHVEKAVFAGARLVVFPENNGLQLFGMLPGMGRQKSRDHLAAEPEVLDILGYAGPVIRRTAVETFSTLARLYQVWIMAGSFMHPDVNGSQIVNRAYLFGPDGALLGTQDKVHLFPTEVAWGLQAGRAFEVVSTELGMLAMPVCMDATFFETFRILREKGADIVTVPIANAETYNPFRALRGVWPRVQESLVFGIKSALVGEFLDYHFTGKAGIYAPLELTEQQDGILAESPEPCSSGQVVADLDLEALQGLRNRHTRQGDTNPLLYQRYFPEIYNELPPEHRL